MTDLPDYDDPKLTPQEEWLVHCAEKGEWWEGNGGVITDGNPVNRDPWHPSRVLRASVIRFLAVGCKWAGEEHPWPVASKGLLIQGAWIVGELDLEGALIENRLVFHQCAFGDTPNLKDARTKTVSFAGSHLPGLIATSAKIEGDIHLREGFATEGNVNLIGANVEGRLDCSRGTFNNPTGESISASAISVGADMFFSNGFAAKGEVNLVRASIGGQISCENGRFDNPNGVALQADSIIVGSSVFLRKDFLAIGEVNFLRAEIGGNVRCYGSTFMNEGGDALDLTLAEIGAGLFLHDLKVPKKGIRGMNGRLVLSQTRCRTYRDDKTSWPEAGKLVLDGFTYERFDDSETTWIHRKQWLERQKVDHLSNSFRPQPWTQAINVLRAMGHDGEARRLAICRENARLRAKSTGWLRKLRMAFSYVTVGYGYRPWQALVWSTLFVAIGWWIFASAGALGYLSPRDSAVRRVEWNRTLSAKPGPELPRTYPPFNGLVYALDAYLPVIEFDQDESWEPSAVKSKSVIHSSPDWTMVTYTPSPPEEFFAHGWHRVYFWASQLLGWLFITLFIAGMSGLMKKE